MRKNKLNSKQIMTLLVILFMALETLIVDSLTLYTGTTAIEDKNELLTWF